MFSLIMQLIQKGLSVVFRHQKSFNESILISSHSQRVCADNQNLCQQARLLLLCNRWRGQNNPCKACVIDLFRLSLCSKHKRVCCSKIFLILPHFTAIAAVMVLANNIEICQHCYPLFYKKCPLLLCLEEDFQCGAEAYSLYKNRYHLSSPPELMFSLQCLFSLSCIFSLFSSSSSLALL